MPRLLVVLPIAVSLLAQSGSKRVEAVARAPVFVRSPKVAVVVGVGDYAPETDMTKLRYAKADAEAVAAALTAQGYSVRLLTDARASESIVSSTVDDAAQLATQDGTLLFYFSGHGFAASAQQNFLATYGVTERDLATKGLSVEKLQTAMAGSRARQIMLFIDACRNQAAPGKKTAGGRSFDQLAANRGTRMLLSTQIGKLSFENDQLGQGVFTHFWLLGLKGEAAGADGYVTFKDLAEYVGKSVGTWSFPGGVTQIPVEKSDEATGDFLLAKVERTSAVPTPPPSRGQVRDNTKDGQLYMYIPAGRFRMGCSAGEESECAENEKPAREVEIPKAFWMGRTEVSVEAFKRFSVATGWNVPDGNSSIGPDAAKTPVVNIDLVDAKAFCEWAGGRVPREAEWEYAARGGVNSAQYGILSEIAWFDRNAGGHQHESAKKLPNNYGLFDTLGNVWEWTIDTLRVEQTFQSYSKKEKPTVFIHHRPVVRGGSWRSSAQGFRVSERLPMGKTSDRRSDLGFRCILE